MTEAGAVAEALAALRAEPGGEDISISELVVIGARAVAAEKRARRTAREHALAMLADRVLAGGPPLGDPEAADEVRRTGWARET